MFFLRLVVCVCMYEKETEIRGEAEEEEKEMCTNDSHNLLNHLFKKILINNSQQVTQVELNGNITLLRKIHVV